MMHYVKVFMAIAVMSSIHENAFGQSLGYGSCPNVDALGHFEPEKYTGRWYEIERVISTFHPCGSCVTADYDAEKDSSGKPTGNILVTETMTNWLGYIKSKSGRAVPLDKSTTDAKYVVSFQGASSNSSYWVLNTDYSTYSVVYSCTSVWGLYNLKYLWLLARDPEPSLYVQQKMQSVLQSKGLSSYLLFKTNQKNCQYT
ncbi:apolipoprotein D isoform X2 [Nilaparvata lugens]|nr:apolipoprotein D isoform X2 [Nilaparvata lugens]XP_022197014.2 apolipoprotein D isoform X2 [Nilaparvata lugens]